MKKIDWDSLPWFIGGQWVIVHDHMVKVMEGMYIVERPKESVVMKQNEFKDGDQVYCPRMGCGVHVLSEVRSATYPVGFDGGNITDSFTKLGQRWRDAKIPSIFHATQENKALLDALYGMEFEAPPVKLSGSDLTRNMFTECDTPILCHVNNLQDGEAAPDNGCLRLVVQIEDDVFVDDTTRAWKHATPYCGQVQTVKGGE